MTAGPWYGMRSGLVTLSVAVLAACSGESTYELGHEAEAGMGGEGDPGSVGGTSASGGKGGTGGSTTGGTAGSTTGGTGGSTTGGSTSGGNAATGNGGDAGSSATGGSGGSGAVTGGSSGTGGTSIVMIEDADILLFRPPPKQLDVLLMIDNSIGMADKQAKLAEALPVLLQRFTTPYCVDGNGNRTGERASGSGVCTLGSPEFAPLNDIHVGVITSSLGDHGSNDVCSEQQNQANVAAGGVAAHYDDHAQLLPSVRSDAGSSDFLSWDGAGDPDDFGLDASAQLDHVGARGCGYEAQLESWYRFLIDPEPVGSLTNNDVTTLRGASNQVVLDQRAAFLRTGSAVAIVMLTDENDCSILDEEQAQGWLVGFKGGVGTINWHMPRASAACEIPDDPCCRPCSSPALAGCAPNDADPSCSLGETLGLNEDSMNLRCVQQVKRFGIDLLYPTSRYASGLMSRLIQPRLDGVDVENPLYAPGPDGAPARDPSMVYLAGIVGVPWQDISTESSWSGRGLEFMTATELQANGRWDVILGDPQNGIQPWDSLMIESVDPRPEGTPHPLLADADIVGTGKPATNPINGREQVAQDYRDDLQFACVYDLPAIIGPTACAADSDSCPCNADEFDKQSPLCGGIMQDSDGAQLKSGAYPSLRELEVLRDIGSQAVVASVCPKNVTVGGTSPSDDPNYGYNPATHALADRMRGTFGGDCLAEALPLAGDNRARCTVLEARPEAECSCDPATGRIQPDGASWAIPFVQDYLNESGQSAFAACLCEIPQLDGAELLACWGNGEPTDELHGFCYVDADAGVGEPSLVGSCPAGQKRRMRYVGEALPAVNALTFVSCNYL
jgi:hypothetical protein